MAGDAAIDAIDDAGEQDNYHMDQLQTMQQTERPSSDGELFLLNCIEFYRKTGKENNRIIVRFFIIIIIVREEENFELLFLLVHAQSHPLAALLFFR